MVIQMITIVTVVVLLLLMHRLNGLVSRKETFAPDKDHVPDVIAGGAMQKVSLSQIQPKADNADSLKEQANNPHTFAEQSSKTAASPAKEDIPGLYDRSSETVTPKNILTGSRTSPSEPDDVEGSGTDAGHRDEHETVHHDPPDEEEENRELQKMEHPLDTTLPHGQSLEDISCAVNTVVNPQTADEKAGDTAARVLYDMQHTDMVEQMLESEEAIALQVKACIARYKQALGEWKAEHGGKPKAGRKTSRGALSAEGDYENFDMKAFLGEIT